MGTCDGIKKFGPRWNDVIPEGHIGQDTPRPIRNRRVHALRFAQGMASTFMR